MANPAAPLALALLLAAAAACGVRAEATDPPAETAALVVAPQARPPEVQAPREASQGPEQRHCTGDGAICISAVSYIPDVCGAIDRAAGASGLDSGFFARLIWRESLFDAAAVSPAGAQGIAQFMPETAKLEGLADSFNPAEALTASAAYLSRLSRDYGNLGLAAAAYNGGRARVERFIAGEGGLPLETRAYVHAITGYSAEDWRDAPPDAVDLTLEGEGDFAARCAALAATRGRRDPEVGPPPPPWGVVIASNRNRAGVERQAQRLKNRNAALLQEERIYYSRARLPGMPRSLYYAQLGRDSRAEANALCARLRAGGGDCLVRRN